MLVKNGQDHKNTWDPGHFPGPINHDFSQTNLFDQVDLLVD